MPKKQKGKVKIIPLGGLNEVGKNLTVVEYENDIIIIDCGLGFPDEEMPGVDLVIPDVSYLEANADKIRGMVLTHGHEDHIGAIPYILRQIPDRRELSPGEVSSARPNAPPSATARQPGLWSMCSAAPAMN